MRIWILLGAIAVLFSVSSVRAQDAGLCDAKKAFASVPRNVLRDFAIAKEIKKRDFQKGIAMEISVANRPGSGLRLAGSVLRSEGKVVDYRVEVKDYPFCILDMMGFSGRHSSPTNVRY